MGGFFLMTNNLRFNPLFKNSFYYSFKPLNYPLTLSVFLNVKYPAINRKNCLASQSLQYTVNQISKFNSQSPNVPGIIINIILATIFYLMLFRLVISWNPNMDRRNFPFNIVFNLTEPFLITSRKIIPPKAGVDISPVIWLATTSLAHEIFLGPYGLLN